MPTAAEQKKLFDIVHDKRPELRPDFSKHLNTDQPEREFFEECSAAFLRVGNLRRLDKLNNKFALSWWVGEANDWLRLRNIHTDVRGSAFCTAVLAHGDIQYQPSDGGEGWVWTFALTPHFRPGERCATGDGWKRLLQPARIEKPETRSRLPPARP
jgi:hypothetical protein